MTVGPPWHTAGERDASVKHSKSRHHCGDGSSRDRVLFRTTLLKVAGCETTMERVYHVEYEHPKNSFQEDYAN